MDVEPAVNFIRRYVLFVGGALGVVLLLAGVYLKPRTTGGTVLVTIGGAMFAAFMIAPHLAVAGRSARPTVSTGCRRGISQPCGAVQR